MRETPADKEEQRKHGPAAIPVLAARAAARRG